MPRSRQLSVPLAVLCALSLLACTGDEPQSPDALPTTTAVSSTTQSQEAADEQALRQLAEDWYAASREAFLDPDYDLNAAEQYLAPPYLDSFIAQIEQYREQGHRSEASDASRHTVLDVEVADEGTAVTECIVDGEVLLDGEGAVLNDQVVTRRVRSEAVRTDAGWRFSARESIADEEEGDTCPA